MSESDLPLSTDEFAHLGQGALAYVKAIRSDEVPSMFPQAPTIQPGSTSTCCWAPTAPRSC